MKVLPQADLLQYAARQIPHERCGLFIPRVQESEWHDVRDVIQWKGVCRDQQSSGALEIDKPYCLLI